MISKPTILIVFSLLIITLISCEEEATFYELKTSVSPVATGSIEPNRGLFEEGTIVSLVATPSLGYNFISWSGDASSSTSRIDVAMDGDKSITANFAISDSDNDGIGDSLDQCENTPENEDADQLGCSPSQRDTDSDTVSDANDLCPDTPQGEIVNSDGCADSQLDTDGDGVADDIDECPSTPDGVNVDEKGCERLIYLAENGVTVIASERAVVGEEYSLNGDDYLIIDKATLREWIVLNKDLSKVVTTFITNMDDLFGGGEIVIDEENGRYEYVNAPGAFDHNISSWDVSNVTSMVRMFAGMSTVRGDSHDLRYWDVSKVTSMKGLLKSTHFLGSNFTGWDTKNVTDMSELLMNSQAPDTGYAGIKEWDTRNVKNMRRAVFGTFMHGIRWNVGQVEDMSEMFRNSYGGTALTSLEEWDVSNAKSMKGMFKNAGAFNAQIGSWDVRNVEDMSDMFNGANGFSRDITSWDVGNVKDMSSMFYGARLFNRDLSSWNVTQVTDCKDFSTLAEAWMAPKPNFTNCSID